MSTETAAKRSWYKIANVESIPSPSLLVFPDRINFNIRKMIEIAGNISRLRPHVKTHKMAPVIKMQMEQGIKKFKCSTIAEMELVAGCGAKDILLAMQPVGPNINRFFKLMDAFPDVKFSAICDCVKVVEAIEHNAKQYNKQVTLYLDIDNGMHRTGVSCDNEAVKIYQKIHDSSYLEAGGLHVYDGHIRHNDPEQRQEACDEDFVCILTLINTLKNIDIVVPTIIAGGTPTFPIHTKRSSVELSPGTPLLWDWGYSEKFADLDFQHAAVLLIRVLSKPRINTLCLDLGHKALASEMEQPRVKLMGIKEYQVVTHSEEHMVIETPEADKWEVGDPLYGIPIHICPTVDRQEKVYIVKDNQIIDQWVVEGRKRVISV